MVASKKQDYIQFIPCIIFKRTIYKQPFSIWKIFNIIGKNKLKQEVKVVNLEVSSMTNIKLKTSKKSLKMFLCNTNS